MLSLYPLLRFGRFSVFGGLIANDDVDQCFVHKSTFSGRHALPEPVGRAFSAPQIRYSFIKERNKEGRTGGDGKRGKRVKSEAKSYMHASTKYTKPQ